VATDAQILAVRKEAQLHDFEYFFDISGTKLELIKKQPPLTIIAVEKNGSELTLTTDYTWDEYRTITLTLAATESDVYRVELGHTVTNDMVGDIYDYAKEEVYSELRTYYTDAQLDASTYVQYLCEKLAAGYLILKYWEGYPNGADFWKYGRNLVDTVHKRKQEILKGEMQLVDGSGDNITKAVSPFQWGILDHAKGLYPSGLYTQTAENVDYEEY